MPKGVSMPPRFAAIFCIINVNAIYFCFPVLLSTRKPSGRNVSSAMSLAMSIEPMNVIYTSASTLMRAVLKKCTILRAITKKKFMSLSAQTTASTQKRQLSVLKSK